MPRRIACAKGTNKSEGPSSRPGDTGGWAISEGEPDIDAEFRDGMRTLADAAVRQATRQLTPLLNAPVIIAAPNVSVVDGGELAMTLAAACAQERAAAVCQGYIGAGIAGESLLVFHSANPNDVARLLRYEGEVSRITGSELLTDLANVLIGACLKGLSDQLDVPFTQSHPRLLDAARPAAELAAGAKKHPNSLAIDTQGHVDGHAVRFDMLWLFTQESIAPLRKLSSYLTS